MESLETEPIPAHPESGLVSSAGSLGTQKRQSHEARRLSAGLSETSCNSMFGDTELLEGTGSTAVTAPTTQPTSTEATSGAAKKMRKRKPKKNLGSSQFTIRNPPWAYVHLQHLSPPRSTAVRLDGVTAHLHLKAALSRFLGLHGEAVPIDILKLEGTDVWIRVPAEDKAALVAAAGGWVSSKGEGWRVKGSSSWDARAMARGSGQDLFGD